MPHRHWTPQEKQAVVLEGLRGVRSVVDVCRKHGVTQDEYYRWRDRFLEGGRRALARDNAEHPPDETRRLRRAVEAQTAAVQRLARLLRTRTTTDH